MAVRMTNGKADARHSKLTLSPYDDKERGKRSAKNSELDLDEQYSGINWQNAVFLPFNSFFANVVILSVNLVVFLVIYKIAYSPKTIMPIREYYILPMCDIIYLIDTLLRAAHNLATKVRQTREYLPTNWFSLIVDITSLIPFNLIHDVWNMDEEASPMYMTGMLLANKLLRIYRMPLNFLQRRSAIGARNLWHLALSYVAMYLVFGHILAALLHTMACWGCEKMNWTYSFPPEILDSSKILNQFLAAATVVLSLNWNNARGNISATQPREWCFFSFAMVTGLFMKSMFYAFLVSSFRRNMWRQLSFMLEVK